VKGTAKQQRETRLTELVETHNIALSINRLGGAPYDDGRWRRALYHALSMSDQAHRDILVKIREALDLP
jgi:hypothetical protein